MIMYRGVGTPPVWDNGQYIETVTDLSYTIVPDANSDKVAVVYTDDRNGLSEGEGSQTDLDVYYKLSTNQGAEWGTPVCVSNYSEDDDSLWRAYTDVSAVITPDGFIHVVAPVRELRSQSSYENYKSRLVHWDVELATGAVSKASVIDEARYTMQLAPNRPCDPDAWNLYIAKPSVSYCDGKLYALYTKFGDDNEPNALNDCSHASFANGELYLAGSDTYLGAALGRTWDTSWNITQTRTPLCDSGLCESDHWSSMARYGFAYGDETVSDTLDIMYINDKDAGGIPQGSGTWTENNVMHYRFACRPVAHIPKISLEPTQFLDPIHTFPDSELTVTLKIGNIGNEVMHIAEVSAVDEGDGTNWINLGSFSATVDPNDFTLINITLNYNTVLSTGPDPAGYDASIKIDHDAPSDVDYVPIHLTVASDFNMPEDTVLNTTCKSLQVFNTARLGGDTEFHSLDIPGDCDSVDNSPNSATYLYDGSPMIAWNNGSENLAYTTVFTQDFTENGTFRPQSKLNFYAETDYNMAVCTVTTTDSLYGVAIALYAPTDGVNCFIIGEYTFFNWNPVRDASEVYLGFMTDWDIPSDNSVDNGSGTATGVDGLYKTMWQFGADYGADNESACPGQIVETDRLGGVAIFKGPDPGEAPLLNAWAAENAPYQLGSGFDKEYLYTQMSTLSGYHPFTGDSLIDLHTGMTFAKVDMTAKASYRYVLGLVTTNQGESDYLAQVEQARAWAVAKGLIVDFVCDCTPGDANHDTQVNVGDAVYMINYVFKSGPSPSPYAICSGDANGDCQANVGDAVYIINYVFKSGPPPPDCDTWVAGCGQPIVK